MTEAGSSSILDRNWAGMFVFSIFNYMGISIGHTGSLNGDGREALIP